MNLFDSYRAAVMRGFEYDELYSMYSGSVSHHDSAAPDDVKAGFHATSALHWASCGFPRVVLSHRLAASLMCTSVDESNVSFPWETFSIVVPTGLVTLDGQTVHEVMFRREGAVGAVSLSWALTPPNAGFMVGKSLTGWTVNDAPGLAPEKKAIDVLVRLVLGVSVELDTSVYQELIQLGPPRPKLRKRGDGVPTCWTFKLTRDVNVDMREPLRQYLFGGKGRSPTVQIMVRGHHKRQPCGPGLSERKWIHIEPYWRGPEDAPIAVRSHLVNS